MPEITDSGFLSLIDSIRSLRVNVIVKIFEEARQCSTYSGLFSAGAKIGLKDRTVRRLVELLENYDLGLTAFDVKGEAFEFFLGDTFTGGLGEYFTPRTVVEFMVDLISPRIGEKIIDPFCGTGGFLIYAFDLVGEKIRLQDFSAEEKQRWRLDLSDKCLFGTDWKERTSQACKMNMMVHGDGSSGIFMHDGLTDVPGKIEGSNFDVCLTNPPFGSFETDESVLKRFELGRGRKQQDRIVLAIERCLDLLKPGGRAAIVVIDGVLNTKRARKVRALIKKSALIRAVISLNPETFEGYGARAKTSVLVLEKRQLDDASAQPAVFMAIAKNTGLAPNGSPIAGNVLPDILLDYKSFVAGQDGLVGAISLSWTTMIKERLDAEYYAPRPAIEMPDFSLVKADIEVARAKANASYTALIHAKDTLKEFKTKSFKVGQLISEYRDRVTKDNNQFYKLLGVRWWGDGTFIREEKQGKHIASPSLYKVRNGTIIFNRLFAFRGSFAVVPQEHAGCFVSNKFPTFSIKEGVGNPDQMARYIVEFLNSARYLSEVDAHSSGSTKTSRNRFYEDQFLDMNIQVPTDESSLFQVIELLDRSDLMEKDQQSMLDLARKLQQAVIGLTLST